MAKFKAGQSGNPKGRPKGIKDKRTTEVLEIINSAHEDLVKAKKSLSAMAQDDPKWFYEKIWVKIIPKDVQVDIDLSHGLAETVYAYLARKDK
jgi:hypothetical protein